MPKRPSPGKCVHCLRYFDVLTWDHVLPESWYPVGVTEIEKWEIPSCETCNKELGKIEENLLIKLGLCLDPKDLKSLGIPDKVLRSLNPVHGKNDRDRKYRKGKREKILRGIRVSNKLPEQGIFPHFGPLPGVEYREFPSVLLDQDELKKFAEKITRGIAYVADKSFIDENYEIELFIIDQQKEGEFEKLAGLSGEVFDRRPGLFVKRTLVENDPVSGFYSIEIWGRFKMYVSVATKDQLKMVPAA